MSPSNVVRWAGIAVGLAGLIFLLSGREHVGNDGFKGKASLNTLQLENSGADSRKSVPESRIGLPPR